MFVYWRVQQDLLCLGEVIQFHDPSFIREIQKWIRRNIAGISLAHGYKADGWIPPSLN